MSDVMEPQFGEDGLVTAVVQDATTSEVLMVAHMNRAAWEATLATGHATFFSRSRQRLWEKGETSGNTMHVKAIRIDCDADCVLLQVHADGPACHTGERTCFFTDLTGQIDANSMEASPQPEMP
jgi:phosphoribosyl-AMP cyclohydrolase